MSVPPQNWVTFEGAAPAPSAPVMLEPSRTVLLLPTFGLELEAASRQVSTIGQPQPRAVTVDTDDINHTAIVGFFASTPKDKLFVRGLDRYNLKFAVRLLDIYGVPPALHLDADTRFPKVVRDLESVGCFQGFMNSLKRCCMSRRLSSSEFDRALSYLIAKSQLQELTLSVSTHFRLSLVELCAQRGINFIFQEPTELILYDNEVERLPFWPQLSVSAYLTIVGLNKILLQIAHGLRPRPDNWQFNVAVPSNIASKYERKREPGQKEQDLPPESREEKEARKREMVLETIEIALLNGIWLPYGRHSIMTPNGIYTFRFTHELWIEVRPLNGDRLDIRFTKTPSTFIPNLVPICAGRQ